MGISFAGRDPRLSRSVSNLGSSLGTAIAGTILVADFASGNTGYVVAMIALAGIALTGLAASLLLPDEKSPAEAGLSHEVAAVGPEPA